MKRPPFFTNGIYARYKALLSLIVSVSNPGLLLGWRITISCVPLGSLAIRFGSSRSWPRGQHFHQRDQPGLHSQLALERGAGQLRFQRPRAIHHAVDAAYVQRPRRTWQVRRTTRERDQVGISGKSPARQRAEPQIEPCQALGQRVFFPLSSDLRHICLTAEQRAERLLHVLVQRIETAVRVG